MQKLKAAARQWVIGRSRTSDSHVYSLWKKYPNRVIFQNPSRFQSVVSTTDDLSAEEPLPDQLQYHVWVVGWR